MSGNPLNVTRPLRHSSSEGDRSSVEARLIVSACPDAGQEGLERVLTAEDVVVGREGNRESLVVHDPFLSRVHLKVSWDDRLRAHRCTDLGSANGTFINGRRVASQCLEQGDVVRAGSTVLLYELADPMEAVLELGRRAAATFASVLLKGETGSGKERLAQFVHAQSGRPGQFVAVNCAALPKDLIASELFGHVRGAFSGAGTARAGMVLAADRGTLFLDEIGDMPLDLQPVLLRVLQERKVRPVGSDREQAVDLRVVAATNADLERAIDDNRFRADLYARLAEVHLNLPPLRERRREILPLLRQFLQEAGCRRELTADAAEALLLWRWPFNVRQVQSLARHASLGMPDAPLDLPSVAAWCPELKALLKDREPATAAPSPYAERREELKRVLRANGGNVAAAARQLGKPRSQLYRWIKEYALGVEDFRDEDRSDRDTMKPD